ncbi:FAD-binding oxidoreductase [Vandammella animalimorsus]|nr:FAD-binding oxidoreductase [Vandammella animalimorsus]
MGMTASQRQATTPATVPVSAWGRLQAAEHQLLVPDALAPEQPWPQAAQGASVLPHGMGRSYGDVCLNPGGALWLGRALDQWLEFDAQQGLLRCQAGVQLGEIQRLLAPRGWMLPVTPGTQFVTVGGAIANDVHGKNHHVMGSFGEHVRALTLLRSDGRRIACAPGQHEDWLRATIGGLGLTGLITEATLQLRRVAGPWLKAQSIAFERLADFYPLAEQSEADWEYTVAWIDCLHPQGRGIFMRANHCQAHEATPAQAPRQPQRSMPVTPPLSLVNPLSLRAFNWAYYHLQRRSAQATAAGQAGGAVSHYRPFFYPLDGLAHWNRMYGPRGFYQYQCVIPFAPAPGSAGPVGADAIAALLEQIARSGQGSFLAVLKTFGQRPAPGMLSFVQPGITLALDFPNRGQVTLRLFEALDAIVRAAGGRLYPAKDARMPAELFQASYPQLAQFLPYRDPGISSAMSRRLLGS